MRLIKTGCLDLISMRRKKGDKQAASSRMAQIRRQKRLAGGRSPGSGHCGERRGETGNTYN